MNGAFFELNGNLGMLSQEKQTVNKSIKATTWTNILSVTLSPGTYIIVGQLNIIGTTDVSKYIAITDNLMSTYNAINFVQKQLYGQVTTLLTLTDEQIISVSAYSQGEPATVSNGILSAIKIK